MSNLLISIAILLSILIVSRSETVQKVSISCWPLNLTEHISNGHIWLATAEMSCKIHKDVFYYSEDMLEVTKIEGLRREYENLLLSLSFDFRSPDLTQSLPAGIGRAVAKSRGHRLKELKVESQHEFDIVKRESFANMPELEKLMIRKNARLEKVPAEAFYDLTNLLELRLDENNIQELHVDLLKNLILLERFSAAGNEMEVIQEQLFRNNKNLKAVDLSNKRLKTINVDFTKLQNIETIKAEGDGRCKIVKGKDVSVDVTQMNVRRLCRN